MDGYECDEYIHEFYSFAVDMEIPGTLEDSFLSVGSEMDIHNSNDQLSRDMRFPTMWYVRPAKAQTSLRIRAV